MQSSIPRFTTVPIVATLLCASIASAQDRYFEQPWTGVTPFSNFEGFSDGLCAVGDVNGDGVVDFALGSESERTVRVWSGHTGALLLEFSSPTHSDFGGRVFPAGDVDGDGAPDLFVGFTDSTMNPTGEIRSGADGSIIRSLSSPSTWPTDLEFTTLGDLDGDGNAEYLTGSPNILVVGGGDVITIFPSSVPPRARIYDGATGSILLELLGQPGDGLGTALTSVDDVDGDGRGDFGCMLKHTSLPVHSGTWGIVGSASGQTVWSVSTTVRDARRVSDIDGDGIDDVALSSLALVQLRSGIDGSLLWSVTSPSSSEWRGKGLDTVDWNKDGFLDLVVNATQFFSTSGSNAGYVQILDGLTGDVLYTAYGEPADKRFGLGVAVLGDVNYDEAPDFAVSGTTLDAADSVRIISGAPLQLTANVHKIALETGGSHEFALAFGSAQANQSALLLGTFSGSTPGVAFGGLSIPINPDVYTKYLLSALSPISLDTSGLGSTSIVIPPNAAPSLAGSTLHYSALAFDNQGNLLEASTAITLILQ